MSDEYRRVLIEWAGRLLPEGLGATRILSAKPVWYHGWGGTDVTPGEEPEFTIDVAYLDAAGQKMTYTLYDSDDNAIKLGELLRQLLALAETE